MSILLVFPFKKVVVIFSLLQGIWILIVLIDCMMLFPEFYVEYIRFIVL